MDSRTIRIFLSSTFRDFGEERDLLVKKVFPALRSRLKDRFVELVDIDLRWGITVEEAERGEVLPICLSEIDRSRPYFIGMLGERYGWVPSTEGYAPELLNTQPWLRDHQGGKSVTELEILHGVLNNRRMRGQAFFYFRSPNYAKKKGGDYLPISKDDLSRQQDLKRRIRQSGYPVVAYPNPEYLAKKLERDLWRLLDSHFPTSSVPDAFERERLRHEAYAAPRRRLYIGGERYLEALEKLLNSEERRILIEGASGGGKSALLANFIHQYKKKHPKYLIHEHYLSASADAADPHVLVRRLIEFIKRKINSSAEIETDPQKLMESFPQWLAAASSWGKKRQTRFIFVLDAINKLTEQRDLRWWPSFLPVGIHFVVSCLPGDVMNAIHGNVQKIGDQGQSTKWTVVKVKPLTKKQSAELLQAYLARFNKKLSSEMVKQVQSHKLSLNPLFIRTLAEELRLFGIHEKLQSRLAHYLTSLTIDDLFERVLERVENDCGRNPVRQAMSAIWASRAGLTEKEILGIASLTPARWAPIRNALDEVLLENNSRQMFAHDYVWIAVKDRYLPTEKNQLLAHQKIASWFTQQSMDRRRAEEEPWQWFTARKWGALKKCLLQPEMFQQVETLEGFRGLSRYWTALEDHMNLNLGLILLKASKSWFIDKNTPRNIRLSTTLIRFLVYCTRYEQAEKIARSSLQALERHYGEAHVESMKGRNLLASIYTLQSRYKDSLSLYEKTIRLCSIDSRKKELYQEHYTDALSGSAENFYYLSDYVNALPRFEMVLKNRTSHLGSTHEKTLQAANNIANVHLESGDYVTALDLHRKNVKQARRILGVDHPSLALYIANFANALEKSGNDLEAINGYQSSIEIYEKSLGSLVSDLTLPLGNLGLLLQRNGDLEEARKLQQRCVDLMRLNLGSRHRETVRGLVNLAAVTEDIEKRKILLDEACTVAYDILGDHPFTAAALGSYAWVLVEDDDLSQAHSKLLQSHEMLCRFLPKDHYQVLESIFALAQLNYYYIDDDEKALVYVKECFELQMTKTDISSSKLTDVCLMIAWILCSRDHFHEAASTLTTAIAHIQQSNLRNHFPPTSLYKELAKIKTNMGENAEAISIYNELIEALLQSNNPDLEEVCELYFDLGSVYEAHDDPAKACIAYENSLRHAIELRGEDDIILTNIWVSLAAAQEAVGRIREAIEARERVESLIRDLNESNEDLEAQRKINREALIRLYELVKD